MPNLFLSPILGAPELTVPSKPAQLPPVPFLDLLLISLQVGTSDYDSKVTGRVEKLPVAISIIGEPGQSSLPRQSAGSCHPNKPVLPSGRDLALFNIAYDSLAGAGKPTAVRAGAEVFQEATPTNYNSWTAQE